VYRNGFVEPEIMHPKPSRKKADLIRREMPKQTPAIRSRNFCEVELGFPVETAIEEAARCQQCPDPTCLTGCPIGINIPAFLKCIADFDFSAGIRILREKNHLPAVCGRVCPAEFNCEKRCSLKERNSQISIGRLERFLADWEANQADRHFPEISPFTGRKAAIIGGGPAGITAAGDLIRLGHKVTVFESFEELGGVLIYGIPEFRLPKSVVRREIEYLAKLGGEFHTSFVVGTMRTIDSILEEYDAVFVGTGVDLPSVADIPGVDLNGVYSANQYLTNMNLGNPIKDHKLLAVIGSGNAAFDCARTAIRLGAKVTLVCKRSRQDIPARPEEVIHAEEEGIVIAPSTLPVHCLGENGWVVSLQCVKAQFDPDDSKAVFIDGAEISYPVDAVVCTIGNSPNPLIAATTPGLEMGEKGNILIEEATGRTSKDRVWAGGEVATGVASIIASMSAGRKAARSMHQFLCSL
jgi:glutamate synthase (NADPH) small chain